METIIEVKGKSWLVAPFFIQAKSMCVEAPRWTKEVRGLKVLQGEKGVSQVLLWPLKDLKWKHSKSRIHTCRWGRYLPRMNSVSHTQTCPCSARMPQCGVHLLHLWCPRDSPGVTVIHRKCHRGRPTHPVDPGGHPSLRQNCLPLRALLSKVPEERLPSLWNGQEIIILDVFPRIMNVRLN